MLTRSVGRVRKGVGNARFLGGYAALRIVDGWCTWSPSHASVCQQTLENEH